MQVIVPLAGEDFISSSGEIKALIRFQGKFLLKHLLDSRPWNLYLTSIAFVLLDTTATRQFASKYLLNWYPQCKIVYLSSTTQGAALSALTVIGLASNLDAPIIVDLADISYKSGLDITAEFGLSPRCGAIALIFQSDKPCYSYLRTDKYGFFCEAAEKKVISSHASTGTYIFKNISTYLKALAYCIDNSEMYTYKNLHYVCPLLNGIKAQGLSVLLEPVSEVVDIKSEI